VLGIVKFHVRGCRIIILLLRRLLLLLLIIIIIIRMRKQSVKWIIRMTFELNLLLHFDRFHHNSSR